MSEKIVILCIFLSIGLKGVLADDFRFMTEQEAGEWRVIINIADYSQKGYVSQRVDNTLFVNMCEVIGRDAVKIWTKDVGLSMAVVPSRRFMYCPDYPDSLEGCVDFEFGNSIHRSGPDKFVLSEKGIDVSMGVCRCEIREVESYSEFKCRSQCPIGCGYK